MISIREFCLYFFSSSSFSSSAVGCCFVFSLLIFWMQHIPGGRVLGLFANVWTKTIYFSSILPISVTLIISDSEHRGQIRGIYIHPNEKEIWENPKRSTQNAKSNCNFQHLYMDICKADLSFLLVLSAPSWLECYWMWAKKRRPSYQIVE